jgi:hypothetical protein
MRGVAFAALGEWTEARITRDSLRAICHGRRAETGDDPTT